MPALAAHLSLWRLSTALTSPLPWLPPPAAPAPAAAADINHHPLQTLALLRPLLPLLHPGGALILTLKFYGRAAGREEEWRRRLEDDLGPGFERVQLLWLLANTQHELTCGAYTGGGAPPPPDSSG